MCLVVTMVTVVVPPTGSSSFSTVDHVTTTRYMSVSMATTDPVISVHFSKLLGYKIRVSFSLRFLDHISCSHLQFLITCTINTGGDIDVFRGRGFTSGGQKSVSGFSAAACKIQDSKYYIESLPLIVKDKRSCFSQDERSAIQLPLDRVFALRKWDT